MNVRRIPLRVKVLAAKEFVILSAFEREHRITLNRVLLILERAPLHPGEQSLRGSLVKSLNGDTRSLEKLARAMKEIDFLDLVTGRPLGSEEKTKRDSEEKDARKVQAWIRKFNEALRREDADSSRRIADRDNEIKRLANIANESNRRRVQEEEKGDALRIRLASARAEAAGVVLPQTETEWLTFWKLANSEV